MPPWIVYGLVIVFFLVLPLVIFFFVEEPTSARSTQQFALDGDSSERTKAVSYGVLGAIFAFICVLTFFAQRSQKAANS